MLRVTMPEIILNEAQIVAAIGEIETAGMPQHMRPDGGQSGAARGAGNQVIEGRASVVS